MNRLACKKQINYLVSLAHENKKQHYDSLNINRITNIELSQIVNPLSANPTKWIQVQCFIGRCPLV